MQKSVTDAARQKGISPQDRFVINAYNPDLIILDGPIVRNYPSLVAGKMTAAIDRYLRMPEIRITTLEGRAPLIGAAAAAFRITNE